MPLSPKTPRMGLTKPTPGGDLFDWCLETNDNWDVVDGYGPPFGAADFDIDGDITMNGFDLTDVRAVGFHTQLAPISTTEEGIIYKSGNELYYNDSNGHQVKITNNGVVNNGGGNSSYVEESISSNFTIDPGSATNWYNANTSGGSFVLTLPQASDVGTKGIWIFDFGGEFDLENLTLACQGSDHIINAGNATSASLRIPFGVYQVVSNGIATWELMVCATYGNNLGNYSMAGTLSVTGATTLTSITASATATFNGNTNIGNSSADALTVTATSTFNSPVTFGDSTEFDDTVLFNAAVTIDANAVINGALTIGSPHTFTANGASNLNGDVVIGTSVSNTLTVNSNTTFAHSTTFAVNINVSGSAGITNDLTVGGDTVLGVGATDTLTVNGGSTFAHSATFNINLTVDGHTSLSGILELDSSSENIDFNNTNGQVTFNNTNGNIEFQTYTFYNGNNHRPLENVTSITPSITPGSPTNVNIKYKNIICGATSTNALIAINYDTDLVGDWAFVKNSTGHLLAVYATNTTTSTTTLIASLSDGTWAKIINVGGSTSGWQFCGHGTN